jgi:hypothetical protein
MLYTITNTGLQNGRPTAIGANTIAVASEATHVFTLANFTTETAPVYTDPEGDAISYIKILSYPQNGNLYLSGIQVNVNDLIFSGNITANNFTYVAEVANDIAYNDLFSFDAADIGSNSLSGLSTGKITMAVASAVNQPPSEVGDNSFILNHGDSIVFTVADFTTATTPAYADPEGDPAAKIKILTLPINGTLKFNGTNVIINQVITVAEISAGYLVYVPDLLVETLQNLSFNFSVADSGSGLFTV